MSFRLSPTSKRHLIGVHPDLVAVVERAILITPVDFRVNEGLRTVARQKQLVAAGASQTMNSRHLTGHAVDLVAMVGKLIRWDWPLYYPIAEAMKQTTRECGISVRWGGNWKSLATTPSPITAASLHKQFPDGPHFEIAP